MAHSITVRSGFKVQLPEPYGEQNGPVTLTITDTAYNQIPAGNFHASDASKPLIDNGLVGGAEDEVVDQAAVVAAPAALTTTQTAGASYTATEQAMLNALKADVTALRTTVANLLTALKGAGKPMSPS